MTEEGVSSKIILTKKMNNQKGKGCVYMKIINQIILKDEIVDDMFRIGYCEEMDEYLLCVCVTWIAWYDRYYHIEKEDYELYKTDKDAFLDKFEIELTKDPKNCFNENFIGADALRDYDGRKDFQNEFDTKGNPYDHHLFYNGILYARIHTGNEDEVVYVPPLRAVLLENGEYYFPLRENCALLVDENDEPLCHVLNID